MQKKHESSSVLKCIYPLLKGWDELWISLKLYKKKFVGIRYLISRCAGLHPENNNQDFTSSNPAGSPSQCSLLFYSHHRSPAFLQFAQQNKQLSNTITGFSKMTHFAPGHNFGQLTRKVCWQAFGILMIYIVTLPIFPGFLAENMESKLIRDFVSCFAQCMMSQISRGSLLLQYM